MLIWSETSKHHFACKENSWLGEEDVDLDIRQSGNICCLKLKGPLKYGEGVKQLDEAVEGALTSGHIHLLLDLSAMPYIDSSGIGLLVQCLTAAKQSGGSLKLLNPSKFTLQTLKLVRVLNLFEVFEDPQQAVASFE